MQSPKNIIIVPIICAKFVTGIVASLKLEKNEQTFKQTKVIPSQTKAQTLDKTGIFETRSISGAR